MAQAAARSAGRQPAEAHPEQPPVAGALSSRRRRHPVSSPKTANWTNDMKNLWNDADAEAMVAAYAATGRRPRPRAARLHDAPARRRAAAGAAWRRQHLRQDQRHRPRRRRVGRALRQGQRLGHGRHRAAGPAGGQARRRCSRRASWHKLVRRGHGGAAARQPHRSRLAQPLGRDAAARLPAAQIRRPHAFDRHPGASSTRTTASRWRKKVFGRRWASCPTSCRASTSPRPRPMSSTPNPTSKA